MTTNKRPGPLYILHAASEGLRPVLVFQIRTLDRAQFMRTGGHLSAKRMAEVDHAILV